MTQKDPQQLKKEHSSDLLEKHGPWPRSVRDLLEDRDIPRRKLLYATAGALASSVALGSPDGDTTSMEVGGVPNADLSQAYRVDHKYVGPDSAKSNISPEEGYEYIAIDTDYEYYGDGTSWIAKGFAGPSVQTGEVFHSRKFEPDFSRNYPLERSSFGLSQPFFLKQHPALSNPIMTASKVANTETDSIGEVADPFWIFSPEDNLYHLFFEVIRSSKPLIGAHAYSPVLTDPDAWTYDGYLDQGPDTIAASWTQPLGRNGDYYIFAAGDGRTYKRVGNWREWEQVAVHSFGDKDRAIRYFRDRYYVFARNSNDDAILVFESQKVPFEYPLEDLSFTEHADSAIATGGTGTKKESPAGRPRVLENGLEVYYLDDRPGYGGLYAARYHIDSNNNITEYDVGPISDGYLYQTDQAGHGVNHAIDYMEGGPSGTEAVVTDVGNPWEICVATPTSERIAWGEMSRNVDQTLTTSYQTVTYNADGAGTYGLPDTANYKFVIPFDGKWRIDADLETTGWDNGGVLTSAFFKKPSGGSSFSELSNTRQRAHRQNQGIAMHHTAVLDLAAGDEIDHRAKAGYTAGKNITGDVGTDKSGIKIRFVGPK